MARVININSNGIQESIDETHDVAGGFIGRPQDSQIIFYYLPVRTITFPQNLTASRGKSTTAALASTTFSIQKNEVEVGTMVFAASGTTATFTMSSETEFTSSDELTIVGPATADIDIDTIRWTLAATK